MVGWVWRQSFERAPRVQARSPFRLCGAAGSGFRRSAGTFDGKPRGGRETEPSDCLRGRAVSSSHLKAVRTSFVRVVSKILSESHLCFILSL